MKTHIMIPVAFGKSRFMSNPHVTLIYLGDQPARNQAAIVSATERLRSQCRPCTVEVTGMEVFDKGLCTVFTLAELTLKSYRNFIDRELARDGIRSPSEYAYRPHLSINEHEFSKVPVAPDWLVDVPPFIWIDRPTLVWVDAQ